MKQLQKMNESIIMLLVLVLLVCSCLSEEDYKILEDLKGQSMELVDKSKTEPIADHQTSIDNINSKLQTIIDKKKPKAEIEMVKSVRNNNPWTGFLSLWSNGNLNSEMANDLKNQIGTAYDQVLDTQTK